MPGLSFGPEKERPGVIKKGRLVEFWRIRSG